MATIWILWSTSTAKSIAYRKGRAKLRGLVSRNYWASASKWWNQRQVQGWAIRWLSGTSKYDSRDAGKQDGSIGTPTAKYDPLGIVWHGHYIRYLKIAGEAFGKMRGLSYLGFTNKAMWLVAERAVTLKVRCVMATGSSLKPIHSHWFCKMKFRPLPGFSNAKQWWPGNNRGFSVQFPR